MQIGPEQPDSEPFVEYGTTAETEDALVGNVAGFRALQQALEKAIAEGTVSVDFADFTRVELGQRSPTNDAQGGLWPAVGCIVVAAALVLVIVEVIHRILHALFG